jgi:protein SCO1
MSKKFIFLSAFFLVLTVGFVAVLGGAGLLEKRYKTISIVKQFRFLNQDSSYITEKDIEGKVAVVEFFFTTCKTICPAMNKTMKEVYEQFKNEPNFLILSHTSDPKNDNVARLKFFADSIGANHKNWLFLTGRKDSLYIAARTSYALDDQRANVIDPETDFIHTQLFALVNKKGEIKRRLYYSNIKEEMDELKADIIKALDE